MSQLFPNSWTDPQFLTTVYSVALLACGLVSIFILLVRRHRWHGLPSRGITPWHIGWLDINLLFCLLVMWAMIAGPLTLRILPSTEPVPVERQAWQAALNGGLLQIGILLIFFFFRLSLPLEKRPSLSASPMDNSKVLSCSILYFLAFMPPRLGVEIAWKAFLDLIKGWGIPVPMDNQDVVVFFDGSVSPPAYITLLILAGLIAPIVEELVFRAGLFRFLKGQVSRNWAIVISSAVFASLHMNVLVFPTLFLMGVVLCLTYEATGNIKVPIVFHALFNLNSILLIALQGPQATGLM